MFSKVERMVSNKFYYSGFMLISGNVSDRQDLKILQNNAFGICVYDLNREYAQSC